MGKGPGMARVARLPSLPRYPGWMDWSSLPLSRAPLCPGMQVGDERHSVSECLAFDDIRREFQHLFYDSHGAMRLLMWHPCQKDVALCLLQLLERVSLVHSASIGL